MNTIRIKEMVRMALTVPKQEEIDSESYITSRKQQPNPTDIIIMDVPLFLRMLEYAKEDAETDMDLHDVTEMATTLSAEDRILTMADYDSIVKNSNEIDEKKLTSAEKRKKEEIVKGMKKSFKGNEAAMYAIATNKAKKLAENGVEKGLPTIKGKLIKNYTQNGDSSYNIEYTDGTKDKIYVNHKEWDIINDFHQQNKKIDESFKQLVGKLKKQGKSKKAATKIAGAVASYKAKGGGKGPTAKQKARMAEAIMRKLKGE